ncbi:aquaporin-like protein [Cunninghamella echinulata]|nr:aquaporin-like protein [Cunninghamella echinulata]
MSDSPSIPRPALYRSNPSEATLTDTSIIYIDSIYNNNNNNNNSNNNCHLSSKTLIDKHHHQQKRYANYPSWIIPWRNFRYKHREFFAEFIGTFVLVLLINGISAEQTLGVTGTKSWLTTSFGSGLAVLVAISISGHVSGAHLNPAVTLTFWIYSGFPKKKVLPYISAQMMGAFSGSAILYTMIHPAIDIFDEGERQINGPMGTAGIFATYPPFYVGPYTAIASEILGTALLLLLIMVTGHPNNSPFYSMQGFMVAAGLMIISLALGYTSGFSLNPARDIGPRVFTAIAGWGVDVFTVSNYYAFIPMFAPLFGGVLGGFVYTVFIDADEPAPAC